jgi:AraC-like DNA-binding protein
MAKLNRIAEGFRGQRLVVLPATVRERVQTHPLLNGLLVTDAGIFPSARLHFIERKHGVPTTLLIACLAGHGWVKMPEEAEQQVVPGSLVWLPANMPHAYGAVEGDPWTIEWVHFRGTEVDSWRELIGIPLSGGVLKNSAKTTAELRLGQVWAHLERGYSLANLAAASGALRSSMAAIAGKLSADDGQQMAQERVAASMVWMKGRLAEPLRLAELASYSGLSVPHYTVLFRRQAGFSPIDWFNRLRIQWACELLDTTQASVAEIARQTGFFDPYYFTRCFRRVVGIPPRKYRRVPKG